MSGCASVFVMLADTDAHNLKLLIHYKLQYNDLILSSFPYKLLDVLPQFSGRIHMEKIRYMLVSRVRNHCKLTALIRFKVFI